MYSSQKIAEALKCWIDKIEKAFLTFRAKTIGSFLIRVNNLSYHWMKKLNYVQKDKKDFKYEFVWTLQKLEEKKRITKEINTSNSCVIGKTRFVIKNGKVALNINCQGENKLRETYDHYYLQEEAIGIAHIDDRFVMFESNIEPKIRLDGNFLSLLNPASENWMHLISEVIPACCSVKQNYNSYDIGILIDQRIPLQGKELIKALLPNHRFIEVAEGVPISIENLITPEEQTSHCGFWSRKKDDSRGIYNFNEEAIVKLKNIISKFSLKKGIETKLVVKRNGFRVIRNQDKILDSLKEIGFLEIEPEKNTNIENMQQFSQASVVVAQAGAAVGNMIFMAKGSTMICLAANTKYTNQKYFKDFADLCGVNLKYVLGDITNSHIYKENTILDVNHPMNAIFDINPKDIISSL